MVTPKKNPLEEEKIVKSSDILESSNPTNDPPKKRKAGRPRGSGRKKVEPEQPYNPEQGLKQGMFFIEMAEKMRMGMGIEKPIDDITKQTFIQSIPAMELKYGAAVSKYMPEMMFFGSLSMIVLDSVKELNIIKSLESDTPDKEINGKDKPD